MTEIDTYYPICSSDYPADFVETITSALTAICDKMSPEAFRTWLMDEGKASDT